LPTATLTCDLLIPKSNQHIYEFIDICDQNWVKFPSLVYDIRCSQALTHSLTDGQTRIQIASGAVFRGWRRYSKRFDDILSRFNSDHE